MEPRLTLAEELLLLALNDEKGTVVMAGSMGLSYGLAGALLIELIEAGLVRFEGKDLVASPSGSARDEILDEGLGNIRSAKRTRDLKYWVGKIGRSGGQIKKKLLNRLVEKRILQKRGAPPAPDLPDDALSAKPIPCRSTGSGRGSGQALRGFTPPDERTAALISLVQACDLTGTLFDKGERREAKKRAKEIGASQPVGTAVARVVEAAKAAMVAATGT